MQRLDALGVLFVGRVQRIQLLFVDDVENPSRTTVSLKRRQRPNQPGLVGMLQLLPEYFSQLTRS